MRYRIIKKEKIKSDKMKKDIILAGVGGQGILTIAAVIGLAAVDKGLFIKQAEVHGMSQRGGEVISHLRISDKEIFSDIIPKGKADMILSLEPLESLRYLDFLKEEGYIITNTKPFENIPNYPEISKILAEISSRKNSRLVDVEEIAREINSVKSANIVLVGAASLFLDIPLENLENGIKQLFGKKGEEVVNQNIFAFRKGRKEAEKQVG